MKLFSYQTRNTSNQWSMNIRAKIPQLSTQEVPQQITVTAAPEKKVKWGPSIWFLFHTLSVKVREERFQSIRHELLNHIYTICTNLPCPICSNHAKEYLNGINMNTIQTKDDFKKLIWAFHNNVNNQKGYPFFPFEEVDTKYSLAVTNNIIIHFISHFSDNSRSVKLLADDLLRSQLCKVLKEWFNRNISAFEP